MPRFTRGFTPILTGAIYLMNIVFVNLNRVKSTPPFKFHLKSSRILSPSIKLVGEVIIRAQSKPLANTTIEKIVLFFWFLEPIWNYNLNSTPLLILWTLALGMGLIHLVWCFSKGLSRLYRLISNDIDWKIFAIASLQTFLLNLDWIESLTTDFFPECTLYFALFFKISNILILLVVVKYSTPFILRTILITVDLYPFTSSENLNFDSHLSNSCASLETSEDYLHIKERQLAYNLSDSSPINLKNSHNLDTAQVIYEDRDEDNSYDSDCISSSVATSEIELIEESKEFHPDHQVVADKVEKEEEESVEEGVIEGEHRLPGAWFEIPATKQVKVYADDICIRISTTSSGEESEDDDSYPEALLYVCRLTFN